MNDVKIGSNKSFGIVFFLVFLIISLYPMLGGDSLRIWSLVTFYYFSNFGFVELKIIISSE